LTARSPAQAGAHDDAPIGALWRDRSGPKLRGGRGHL